MDKKELKKIAKWKMLLEDISATLIIGLAILLSIIAILLLTKVGD